MRSFVGTKIKAMEWIRRNEGDEYMDVRERIVGYALYDESYVDEDGDVEEGKLLYRCNTREEMKAYLDSNEVEDEARIETVLQEWHVEDGIKMETHGDENEWAYNFEV